MKTAMQEVFEKLRDSDILSDRQKIGILPFIERQIEKERQQIADALTENLLFENSKQEEFYIADYLIKNF